MARAEGCTDERAPKEKTMKYLNDDLLEGILEVKKAQLEELKAMTMPMVDERYSTREKYAESIMTIS
jgi:hypothetical protein